MVSDEADMFSLGVSSALTSVGFERFFTGFRRPKILIHCNLHIIESQNESHSFFDIFVFT